MGGKCCFNKGERKGKGYSWSEETRQRSRRATRLSASATYIASSIHFVHLFSEKFADTVSPSEIHSRCVIQHNLEEIQS